MSVSENNRFWISWYESSEDPRPSHNYDSAPEWWCTGYRVNVDNNTTASIICAIVDAPTAQDAYAVIRKFWNPDAWRFVEMRPKGWVPSSDRFPPGGER